jgi:hypothetical protein
MFCSCIRLFVHLAKSGVISLLEFHQRISYVTDDLSIEEVYFGYLFDLSCIKN